jgi:hypothetical protein
LFKVKKYENSIIKDIQINKLNDPEKIKFLLSASNSAITQLEKGGNQFTKVDYIAITILLTRLVGNIYSIKDLEKSTISDLIVIIKSIIYDPNIHQRGGSLELNTLINKGIKDEEDTPKKKKEIKAIEDAPKKMKEIKAIEDAPKKKKEIKAIEDAPKKIKEVKAIEDTPKKNKKNINSEMVLYK